MLAQAAQHNPSVLPGRLHNQELNNFNGTLAHSGSGHPGLSSHLNRACGSWNIYWSNQPNTKL